MVKKNFKTFNGKLYALSNKAINKENAERDADVLRTMGFSTKITKSTGYSYKVWYRRKSKW
jgi:hypothetical protein